MKNPVGYQSEVVGVAFHDDGIVSILRRNGWGFCSQNNYYRLGKRRQKALRILAHDLLQAGRWGKPNPASFSEIYGEAWLTPL